MVRAKLTKLLSVIAILFFSASLAHGQEFRAFVVGTGSFLENERFFTKANQPFRSNYASGGKIIFGGEYPLSNIFGAEGSYGYGRNNLRVASLGPSQTLGYGVRSQRVSANLVGHSPVSLLGVRPYATGGFEFDHFGPTSQARTVAFTQGFAGQVVTLGSANKLGVNFGGGVEWSSFPTLALRLDLRDHLTGTPTYGLSGGRFPISGAAHDVEFSVGLVFHMGK
jgi:Outer membrane protein beta-barrel domain